MRRTGIIVRFEGAFEAAAARACRAAFLRGLSGVTLDFSRARHVDDSGLAVLAGDLAERNARAVAIVGLDRHHERLLRYLGAPLPTLAAARSVLGE